MCSCNIYAWTLSILERKYRPGMAGSCCIWFFCFHAFELSFGGNDNGVEFFILYEQCLTWSRVGNGCIFGLAGKWNECKKI